MDIFDLKSDQILALGVDEEDLARLRDLTPFFSVDRSQDGSEISLEYARLTLKIIDSILSRGEELASHQGLPADMYFRLARTQSNFIRARVKVLKAIEINVAARQRLFPSASVYLGE